jgi:hypothetical protein
MHHPWAILINYSTSCFVFKHLQCKLFVKVQMDIELICLAEFPSVTDLLNNFVTSFS